MNSSKLYERFQKLLDNSRFWVLTSGLIASIVILGLVEQRVPSGLLQNIRLEQIYGFLSILFLYLAMLASPLTAVFPGMPGKGFYLHARRAIGVLAFYYAFLHVFITFFKQLGGFSGIQYLNTKYSVALALGFFALLVLLAMAATSLDWAVKTMGFKHWKLLHRFVYGASVAVLVHIIVIGPHYSSLSLLSIITLMAAAFLLLLEAVRFYEFIRARKNPRPQAKKS